MYFFELFYVLIFILLYIGSWIPFFSGTNGNTCDRVEYMITVTSQLSHKDPNTSKLEHQPQTKTTEKKKQNHSTFQHVSPLAARSTVPYVPFSVKKEYSQFHEFYCEVSPLISSICDYYHFKMKNSFTDSRLRSWLLGFSDAQCDERREMLDSWLKELLTNSLFMTNLDIFTALCKFLELDCKLFDS